MNVYYSLKFPDDNMFDHCDTPNTMYHSRRYLSLFSFTKRNREGITAPTINRKDVFRRMYRVLYVWIMWTAARSIVTKWGGGGNARGAHLCARCCTPCRSRVWGYARSNAVKTPFGASFLIVCDFFVFGVMFPVALRRRTFVAITIHLSG